MKKIILIAAVALTTMLSCKNGDVVFSDYSTQSVYFPQQRPVRTIILGEDRYDNSMDLAHQFDVGICISGVYENNKSYNVDFSVAPELLALDSDGQAVWGINSVTNEEAELKALNPDDYEFIDDNGKFVISSGDYIGTKRIQLKESFFEDPDSYKFTYVLPLQLTNTDSGSILRGISNTADGETPNPLVDDDWAVDNTPKDYTLFGVKFVNVWHGNYFWKGTQVSSTGETTVIRNEDMESNYVISVETTGYKKALYKRNGAFADADKYSVLEFSDPNEEGIGDITISAMDGASYSSIKGTGRYYGSETDFAKKHGLWLVNPDDGSEYSHLTMTLDYEVSYEDGTSYFNRDTVVIRDNAVCYEEFAVEYR